MDTATLLLLLALIGGNAELKNSLRSLLTLYRENRELIMALMNNEAPPPPHGPPPPPPKEPPQEPRDEKSRTHVGGGRLDLLDELLKKL